MENLKQFTDNIYLILKDKLNELQILEQEKEQIMQSFALADNSQRLKIADQMKQSENKFRALCENLLELKEKVAKLKTEIM